jgi:hypothetical protein
MALGDVDPQRRIRELEAALALEREARGTLEARTARAEKSAQDAWSFAKTIARGGRLTGRGPGEQDTG